MIAEGGAASKQRSRVQAFDENQHPLSVSHYVVLYLFALNYFLSNSNASQIHLDCDAWVNMLLPIKTRSSLVDTLPRSIAFQSWIIGRFPRSSLVRECSTVTSGLPIGRSLIMWSVKEHVKHVLTIDGRLPVWSLVCSRGQVLLDHQGHGEEYRGMI